MADNSNSGGGNSGSGSSAPKPAPPQGPPVNLVKGGRTPGTNVRTGSTGSGGKRK
jgi:hypothetical protein